MWEQLSEWWTDEVAGDPAYTEEVIPLLTEVLQPLPGERVLDAGIGEGQVARVFRDAGSEVVGVDLSPELAGAAGASVAGSITDLEFFHDSCFDTAYVSLVLEHLPQPHGVFEQLARVVKPDGRVGLVINHPIATAPESGPIVDAMDGELFWRPGRYLGTGFTEEPAGDTVVRFYHRSMSALLNAAASAGLALEQIEERGVSERQILRDPGYEGHQDHAKLLACRWRV